ncbi:MAG: dihydrodipicolinate synthase family protein [Rhodospirillales bacterium]|jgi:4-hydroxy-tetrahydrodipicolinate synthase|nr:dihydrodipicolinate synthase family protein [Rhodospirillales bacterium]
MDKRYSDSDFRGQIYLPAPVTPFAANGDLMLDAFADVLRFYLDVCAVDSFVIAGNNGEGSAISAPELGRLVETATKVVAGRVPFFAHVTRTSNRESIARAEIAAAAGATGICLMGQPYIHKATEAEIVDRFVAVTKAVPLPMYVFNDVGHQGFSISANTLSAICEVAPVVVMSDGARDLGAALQTIAAFGDRFPILYGPPALLVPALLLDAGGLGGTGLELFGARVRPELLDIHERTPAERLEIVRRYGAVAAAVARFGSPPAGMKAALAMLGVPAGVPREPVQPLAPADEEALRGELTRLGVFGRPGD